MLRFTVLYVIAILYCILQIHVVLYKLRSCCVAYISAQQSLGGQGLIIESLRSDSDTPHWVRLLWTSDQPVSETSDNTQHSQQTSMPLAGSEPAVLASKRPQTHASDLATILISVIRNTAYNSSVYFTLHILVEVLGAMNPVCY